MTSTRFANHTNNSPATQDEQGGHDFAIYARHRCAETAAVQIETCLQWLEAESGHTTNVLIFSDSEVNAVLPCSEREGYQAMLTAAQEGRFNTLLIHSLNRISRNINEAIVKRLELERLGIWLVESRDELRQGPSSMDSRILWARLLDAFNCPSPPPTQPI